VIEFLRRANIGYLRIGMPSGPGTIPWRTQLDELVKLTLEFLIDANNYPVLVSSSSAIHLCTIVGCLRRMQGWNLCSIMEEFRRYTPEQPISMYKNYVEMFDFDLVNIPESSPLRERS
jgi:protein tyrosine/serine phosphatase